MSNKNVTKIERLSSGMVKLYNRSSVIGAFSALNSISIGYENNNARTIQFTDNGNTISFQVFNLQEIIGSTTTVTYTPIDTTSTGPEYNSRVFEVFDFLSSQVFQGFSPGPTFVGGVVASYPNFASFPATGQQSVIYIDESTNQAYYWDGSSYQLLTSTGVETYPNFASFPATGMANIIYVDLSVPESYVWDGSVYVSLDGGSVAWGSIIGTLSAQTDLQAALDAKFDDPTGTTSEYIRGDGSLATFPVIPAQYNPTAGTGISITGSYPNQTITNTAPDQTVALTAGTGIGVTGTYPNFTITNSSPSSGGTVTSVGLKMPSAFNVANSPITTSGLLDVTGAGTVSQYVRGDGSLANFPSSSGGGASLSFYLNGSVSQGTFGGIAFKEMDRTPILGAGTDFSINADGYIQSFITDANVPNLLEIPGGNWNFETYFSASSGGGTPSFYVELYKWDGATLSLIASASGSPESITNGTAIDLYISALAVPQTTLAATDRLAVRIWVNHSGRTITLHTENSHLCQVITTFTTGLTALNGLTAQVQNFATGTAGTDFGISSVTSTHTFNLPTASATNRGALSSADWTMFNSKVPSTRTLTINGTTQDLSANRTFSVGTVTSVGVTAGTGISVSGSPIISSGSITVTNSAPDQVVALTAGSGIGVTGTYPNFTISNSDPTSGVTLSSAGGTESLVNDGTGPSLATKGLTAGTGISLSGTSTAVTVTNSAPDQVVALTAGTGIGVTGTYPNFTVTNSAPSSGGTVTSVAALTLGTTGTDLSSTVANGTTTPVITLNVPTASATNRGALSSADWTTFNSKVPSTRTLTINGTTQDLSADRTFTISSTNIYNTDGSLTGARTLTLNSNPLTIAGTSSTRFHANGNVGIGTTIDAGYKLDVVGSDARINEITVGRGGGSGAGNTAIGKNALLSNLIGTSNTAVGNNALGLNQGTGNTAVGNGALLDNVTGVANTAVGVTALSSNTANNNTAVGGYALYLNTTGGQNTAIGTNASEANTTGINNVAIGYIALGSNTTTSQNVAVGHSSLRNNIAGSNTALGFGAGYNGGTNANTTGTNNIFIGTNAIGVSATDSNRTWIGNASTATTWLGGNVLIGTTSSAASAILQADSTTKGFLPPRMTTTEKNAIASPASGLVVYDSTLNVLNFYNGSSWTSGSSGGTVTSVAALTLGTTGTDLTSTVATGTTTPVITLNVPTASATNRGALSSTDWNTFNNKQNTLSLTTIGTSGPATLVGSTLNIPQYSGGGGGGVSAGDAIAYAIALG